MKINPTIEMQKTTNSIMEYILIAFTYPNKSCLLMLNIYYYENNNYVLFIYKIRLVNESMGYCIGLTIRS